MLGGTAGPGLLDTYDTERRPVGSFATEQAYTRYVLRLDPSLGKENLMPIVDEAAVELGYRHLSDAVRGGGRRRRRALGGPARADGAAGDAGAAPPDRPGRDARPRSSTSSATGSSCSRGETAAAGRRRQAVWMFR